MVRNKKAWRAGYSAYCAAIPMQDCPHTSADPSNYSLWIQGWLDAEEDNK